ncbi:uncharacterized protein [Epargyreus clarus]|uniref:uncharacterized protein n=1 Tax=Epargyreus clarus TaxID=520877 RepID=UPI003C2FBC42
MSNYTSTLWTKLCEEQLDKDNTNELESTTKSDIELPPRNLSQRWRRYGHDAKRRVFERFSKWCPKGSATSNLFIYLKTDQTFPEFVLKSVIGFFGGIVLTYLCFVFFVFQLSISLIHATIMSSIIGVLLTFGLAFSYRIRCLVFLLIPQLFSRVGRYTLTCYALVLILTGPATNTLKNSEVLTESMACTQEQIKTDVKQITDSANKPFNSMRDTIKIMIARLNGIAHKVDGILAKINRLGYAIGLRTFTNRVKAMFFIKLHMHHSYTFTTNTSRSPGQVTAGIVTEIRNRADPLLTWLSWSSCVTSLFLLLIIFRAKYYQHMYETRSRFDNRYVTKELRDLDLQRLQEGRDTVLPLNRRERAKYVTTTSLRLVASEKVHLTRSVVFMTITTFKLMIHMIADYSLYWVLMTIRYHGKRQTNLPPGPKDAGVLITGTGLIAEMLRSIFRAFTIPLSEPTSSLSCLPDPYPPDLKRYTHIGILIFLLWFFALFEPYGLRLRHLIMGHYRPERATARAIWLYNHILRTRGSFMKFARRKLHKEYKYLPEEKLTFRYWLSSHIPCRWLRYILGLSPSKPKCLLCNAKEVKNNPSTELIRCETQDCPGKFCVSCYSDIGRLCTICLTPVDYGDFSDISLEKYERSSEDSEDSSSSNCDKTNLQAKPKTYFKSKNNDDGHEKDRLLGKVKQFNKRLPRFYSSTKRNDNHDKEPLLDTSEDEFEDDIYNKHFTFDKQTLDLTNFAVPKSNITVGYVYQNYLCNEKLLLRNTIPNLLKNSDHKGAEYKSNSTENDKINYGSFKNTLEMNSKSIKRHKKSSAIKKPKIIRNKSTANRYKTIAKLKKKGYTKLKSRSKIFKIKRKKSQEYYQRKCNVMGQKMKEFFLHIKSSRIEIFHKIKDTDKLKLNNYDIKNTSNAIQMPKKSYKIRRFCRKATRTKANQKQGRSCKKNVTGGRALRETNNKLNIKSNLPYEAVNNNNKKLKNDVNKNHRKKPKNDRRNSCIGRCRKLFCQHFIKLRFLFKTNSKTNKYSNEETLPILNYKTNYKRRKKYFTNVSDKEDIRNKNRKTRKDIEITRRYRIYTFLKEGEWIKGHFGKDSNRRTNTFTAHKTNNRVDTRTEIRKCENINRLDNRQSRERICNCTCNDQNVCCACDEPCINNNKVDFSENKPSISSEAEEIIKDMKLFKRDDEVSLKPAEHSHLPILSKSCNKFCDIEQLSPSVKSFSIKDVKMYISNKFLHLQFRNPIAMLKNLLTSISGTKQNVSTPDITVREENKAANKGVSALPTTESCPCQCEIISKTMLNTPEKTHSKKPKISFSFSDDKQNQTKVKTRHNGTQSSQRNRSYVGINDDYECPCTGIGRNRL